MIFFPYKADLNLNRFPVWTVLIMVICIAVHLGQQRSFESVLRFAESFCTEERSRSFWLAMDRLAGEASPNACARLMFAIHNKEDHAAEIERLANEAKPYETISVEAGHRRNAELLKETYASFKAGVPGDFTSRLYYDPRSYNFVKMVTAAFAHGDWSHLIGNLFFFYAFAATVEAIIGFILFPLVILGLCFGTHLAYSLWTLGGGNAAPTLGISGVVMGMIGLFTYFMPTGGIRCFVWILIWLRTFVIPAWIIMSWFVGFDLYNLSHDDGGTRVNFMAHVSGALLGLLLGIVVFRRRRDEVQQEFRAATGKRTWSRS